MPNVTSTLSADQEYVSWEASPTGNRAKHSIIIKGGANVSSKHFVTLDGVVTSITDEQAAILQQNPAFKFHEERGFVKIHRTSKAVTKDLEAADKSAPITKAKVEKRKLTVITNEG